MVGSVLQTYNLVETLSSTQTSWAHAHDENVNVAVRIYVNKGQTVAPGALGGASTASEARRPTYQPW